ncbi:hypothetical protein EJ04DRAFT_595982 [Polyplosphaeria fusca]|uniref:Peptidase A1 domain-containing protein n=1 Tax=Polyplosphaeria fusca TaxID=682080 RepID=A0A9P4QLN2_9PLEO|nr:hypothetical protein EJ04DRAFT_595982 [Polyplosphaeria fusca]
MSAKETTFSIHTADPNDVIVRTENVPALTTIFTPPSGCFRRFVTSLSLPIPLNFSSFYWEITSATVLSVGGIDEDFGYNSCQPFGAAGVDFSPGVCPDRHTIADITVLQPSEYTGTPTLWQGVCCLSGMHLGPYTDNAGLAIYGLDLCLSQIEGDLPILTPTLTGDVYMVTTVDSNGLAGTSLSTSTFLNYDYDTPLTISGGLAVADPKYVYWKRSDLSLFPSEYATSLAKKIGITLPALSPSATSSRATLPASSSRAASPQPPHKLTSGVLTGIVVGVVAFLALLSIILFILYHRRRKARSATPSQQGDMAEMEESDEALAKRKWFLGGKWRSEVEVQEKTHELHSRNVRIVPGPPVELDAEGATESDASASVRLRA